MDDYNLFPDECPLNLNMFDDREFLSQDIASAFQEQTQTLQQQSLSSECPSKTVSNSSTDETTFDFERPSKLLKTTTSTSSNFDSSTITKTLSPKLSPSSSFQSQILSFDNTNTQFYEFHCTLNPTQNEMVSVSVPKRENHGSQLKPQKGHRNIKTLKQKPLMLRGLLLMLKITSWLRESEERNSARASLLLQPLFLA